MTIPKLHTSVYLTLEARRLLKELAQLYGVPKTSVLEVVIRHDAERWGIPIRAANDHREVLAYARPDTT